MECREWVIFYTLYTAYSLYTKHCGDLKNNVEKIKDLLLSFVMLVFSRMSSFWVVTSTKMQIWLNTATHEFLFESTSWNPLSLSLSLGCANIKKHNFSHITFFIHSPFLRNRLNPSHVPHCPICDAHQVGCQSTWMHQMHSYMHTFIDHCRLAELEMHCTIEPDLSDAKQCCDHLRRTERLCFLKGKTTR